MALRAVRRSAAAVACRGLTAATLSRRAGTAPSLAARAVAAAAASAQQPHAARRAISSNAAASTAAHLSASKHNSLSNMTREWATARIHLARLETKTSYAALAKTVGRSEVWTASALLGQQAMSHVEAERAADALSITDTQERARLIALLQECPSKGSLNPVIPTDPLIYRFHEIVQVYGSTFKALIHEKFGDGIMSAVDFDMHLTKETGKKGEDRVRITMSGKFLPFSKW